MFFDIGLTELLIVAVVTLIVIGPQRLPQTLRTLGLWIGRAKRTFAKISAEIEREIGMDEVRQDLFNESILEKIQQDTKQGNSVATRPIEQSSVQQADDSQAVEQAAQIDTDSCANAQQTCTDIAKK